MSLAGLIGGCLALGLPTGVLAASRPTIESVSVRNVTLHDAVLEATINPEGLSSFGADYQFQVVAEPGEYLPEIVCPERMPPGWDGCGTGTVTPGALPIGGVPSGTEGKSVSLDLASARTTLKPDTTYHYRLLTANAKVTEDTLEWEGPPAYSADQTFRTPAAAAPSVESESASHVTSTDATLEATINPEDAEWSAYYQFQIVADPSGYLSVFTCPAGQSHTVECLLSELDNEAEGLPLGKIDAGVGGKAVSLDLAGAGVALEPETTYHYRVIAAREAPHEEGPAWQGPIAAGPDQTFTTSPTGAAPSEVITEPAEATPTGYKLKGKLNPGRLPTTYYYEYIGDNEVECLGIDNCWRTTTRVGPITGNAQQEVPPIEVTGLAVGVTYRYRLVASNADGTLRGSNVSFTVTATAAPGEVVTEPIEVTANGFRLRGKVNPDGLPTIYYFEYGSTTCDELPSCKMRTAVVGPLTGDAQEEVPPVEVTRLTAGETYWYRLVASNADGTEGGAFVMFTVLPEGHNGPSRQAKQEPKSEPPTLLVTPLTVTPSPIETTKPKPLTKVQKLANALKACGSKPKKQRAACKRQARKKYGKAAKTGKYAKK